MRKLFLAPVIAVAVGGCEPTQLYIGHTTVIGLDAAVNTERAAGHLIFGYDRGFVAVAPKAVKPTQRDDDEDDEEVSPDARDAMSALTCTQVEVENIFLTRYSEHLATGSAARRAARTIADPQSEALAKSWFDCWRDDLKTESEQEATQ